MKKELQIIIRDWSVVGNDRLVGVLHTREPASASRTIMTSPVVCVRLMGADAAPLAFTASGSMYWLGEPAGKYGVARAQAFVADKATGEPPAPRPAGDPDQRTTVLRD